MRTELRSAHPFSITASLSLRQAWARGTTFGAQQASEYSVRPWPPSSPSPSSPAPSVASERLLVPGFVALLGTSWTTSQSAPQTGFHPQHVQEPYVSTSAARPIIGDVSGPHSCSRSGRKAHTGLLKLSRHRGETRHPQPFRSTCRQTRTGQHSAAATPSGRPILGS